MTKPSRLNIGDLVCDRAGHYYILIEVLETKQVRYLETPWCYVACPVNADLFPNLPMYRRRKFKEQGLTLVRKK